LGMAAIVVGAGLAAFGLLPKSAPEQQSLPIDVIAPLENAPLTAAHWRVAGLLALALVIDIMKPASLGFVTPGMRTEYHVSAGLVSWLPFAALSAASSRRAPSRRCCSRSSAGASCGFSTCRPA